MKNIYKVLVGIVLALWMVNPVTVNAERLTVNSVEYQMWQQANKPSFDKVAINDYSDLVVNLSDAKYTNYLYQYLDDVPESVLNHLRSKGWMIFIEDHSYLNNGCEVAGYTQFYGGPRIISISTTYENCDPGVALIHEIGHVIYFEMTNTAEFHLYSDIVTFELDVTTYHDNSFQEYIHWRNTEEIAEFFYDYIYYPVETAGTAPYISAFYNTILR